MEVLHVISSLETGGAQKLVADLLPVLNGQKDIKTKLVVFRKTGNDFEQKLYEEGVEIISLESGLRSPGAIKKLIPIMKKADMVHAHLFPVNYIVAVANISARKPLVFTEHSTHNRRRDHKALRLPEKLMYSQYDKVACISEAVRDNLSDWIGKKRANKRLEVITNGIDTDIYDKTEGVSSYECFGREGIPVIMISRFTDSKDHPTFIRAIKNIENKSVFGVLAGDGENRPEMERLAQELGVEDRILFLGTRSDIPRLIKSSSIGVQSSNWEGFGLTAIEMMAGGIPVVASEVEGLKQVVEGGGLIFPKGDYNSLTSIIENLVGDTELYKEIARKGKEKAGLYSIENTARQYVSLYRKLIQPYRLNQAR